MHTDGWKEMIIEAVTRAALGDGELLNSMATTLAEQDAAKDRLRALGFGVTGTPWPRVIDEIETEDGRH